ncbi:DUF1824 family protein [Cyanobium sp. ATX 6F1]|nr:DUF1824 family protein [Cyanobium sp. ATX 6F1]
MALRGLRTAPTLGATERQGLRAELDEKLAACEWFTIGVMAADGATAIAALRQLERQHGWSPLEADPSEAAGTPSGGVFLKGNQNTGRFRLRQEAGLGLGVLISGHSSVAPEAEDTWGPFPLDFFA